VADIAPTRYPGSVPTDDERSQLEGWILGLEYPSYGSPWLKARQLADFDSLDPVRSPPGEDPDQDALRACFAAFMAGTIDSAAVRRRVIAAFLWNELSGYIPEHAEWYRLVGSDWGPADAVGARAAVDQIFEESSRWNAPTEDDADEEAVRKGDVAEGASAHDDTTSIDYEALRDAFFGRLFDPASVGYFVQRAGAGSGRPDALVAIDMRLETSSIAGPEGFGAATPKIPAVIGLDRHIVAVFWFN
jgi:hypothetical protein